MSTEHIAALKNWTHDLMQDGESDSPISLDTAVELISKNFQVHPHEVAILGVTANRSFLRFLAPDNLRSVGQIPLTSMQSLASRTVRDKRAEMINNFGVVPHASVFEAVPGADKQRTDPVQKIMSSPIIHENRVIGVVQVCRKGKAAAEAGEDFTQTQLWELRTISDALAPCILRCAQE